MRYRTCLRTGGMLLGLLISTGGTAGQAQVAGSAPVPKEPFTLDCTGDFTGEQNFTWGPRYGRNTKSLPQRFRIDTAAGTVELANGYISESEPWGAKPMTSKIQTITPSGRIVVCTRADGNPCAKAVTSSDANGRSVAFMTGPVIIDVAANKWSTWVKMWVAAKDGSFYIDQNMTEGVCKRV